MKNLIVILIFYVQLAVVHAQLIKVGTTNYRSEFSIKEGKLNGEYISFYKNGNVKARGELINNVRTGKWIVNDSTGKKIHERNYSNDFLSFVKLFPVPEEKGPASLFDSSFYHAVKDKSGMIPYFPLKERAVVYASRLWRNIPKDQNQHLYAKDFLYKIVFAFVTDSSNLSYCSEDDDFAKQIFPSQLKKYSLKNYAIINYKIKEDCIIDSDRMVSESRIIGICPVGVNLKTKDTLDLYWIYFPYLREPFSENVTKIKNAKGEPQTIDDIFFFRNFSSLIYKKANVYDMLLKDYCKTTAKLEREQWRIETEILEAEHDFWIGKMPD